MIRSLMFALALVGATAPSQKTVLNEAFPHLSWYGITAEKPGLKVVVEAKQTSIEIIRSQVDAFNKKTYVAQLEGLEDGLFQYVNQEDSRSAAVQALLEIGVLLGEEAVTGPPPTTAALQASPRTQVDLTHVGNLVVLVNR